MNGRNKFAFDWVRIAGSGFDIRLDRFLLASVGYDICLGWLHLAADRFHIAVGWRALRLAESCLPVAGRN